MNLLKYFVRPFASLLAIILLSIATMLFLVAFLPLLALSVMFCYIEMLLKSAEIRLTEGAKGNDGLETGKRQGGIVTKLLLAGLQLLGCVLCTVSLVFMTATLCALIISSSIFMPFLLVLPHTCFHDCFKSKILDPMLGRMCIFLVTEFEKLEENPEFQRRLEDYPLLENAFLSFKSVLAKGLALVSGADVPPAATVLQESTLKTFEGQAAGHSTS